LALEANATEPNLFDKKDRITGDKGRIPAKG
jgi:hypothetical protein